MILHLGNNTLAVGKMWVAGKDDWGVGAQEGDHLDVLMETGIEFDVPVGETGTLGKVDDMLEEGATWDNHPACKLESA